MSPLDLHVLSTPPAFVLSHDQTLMFNPYPQLPRLLTSRSPKPAAFLTSSRRFTLSNLTVCRRLVAPFSALRQHFLYKMTFSVSFSRIVSRPLRCFAPSLAATCDIIASPPPLVNPFFASFPFHNPTRSFPRISSLFAELCLFLSSLPSVFFIFIVSNTHNSHFPCKKKSLLPRRIYSGFRLPMFDDCPDGRYYGMFCKKWGCGDLFLRV